MSVSNVRIEKKLRFSQSVHFQKSDRLIRIIDICKTANSNIQHVLDTMDYLYHVDFIGYIHNGCAITTQNAW